MSEWIEIDKDQKFIALEKEKAKKLKKSWWWKNRISTGLCHYCNEKFPPDELTMDHVVPLSRGGKSSKNNAVPSCKPCNSKKKYFTPVEMLFDEMKK